MKLKSSDFRIGNYLQDTSCNLMTINTLSTELNYTYSCDYVNLPKIDKDGDGNIEPIPLNEEWLLKFRFDDKTVLEFVDRYFIGGEFSIDYNRVHKYYRFNVGYEFNIQIDNVHELQNLYFALTNEELTLKK